MFLKLFLSSYYRCTLFLIGGADKFNILAIDALKFPPFAILGMLVIAYIPTTFLAERFLALSDAAKHL